MLTSIRLDSIPLATYATHMVQWCKTLAQSKTFQHFVLGVILFNAVLIGVETSRELMVSHHTLLKTLNIAVQVIFVFELIVRLISYAPRVQNFFKDGWNVFDFLILVISLIPAAGPMATVVRVARVLRVARLVSIWPELRLIVGTMLRSIPSMGHVITLAGLLIYIYGVVGTMLYRDLDPAHWGSLGRSCLTLFQILTLEGWAEMQATLLPSAPNAWIFFTTYIVVAVFVVINLFIAVVTNNLQSVKLEHTVETDASSVQRELLESVRDLRDRLERFEARVRADADKK
jgi:voltage-gated sodium channel